jgi:hypothetical protein
LVVKEPEALVFNPETDGNIKPGQLDRLDPNDPLTFITYAHFPPPLPLDKLVLLNELAQKMSMGLESKVGALRTLGEEFPEEKLQEIRAELIADAQSEGSINLVKVQIQKQIMDMTGMMAAPDGTATPIDPMATGSGEVLGDAIPTGTASAEEQTASQVETFEAENQIRQTLLNQAYGTNVPPRLTIDRE